MVTLWFLPRFRPLRSVKPYSCFGGLYVGVLQLVRSSKRVASSSKKPNPSPACLGPPFLGKRGCHNGTQEVERV